MLCCLQCADFSAGDNKMPQKLGSGLSRREREALDVLHHRGRATAAEVQEALPDAPSYSAVRSILRVLMQKGHVRHEGEGKRYVYLPMEPRPAAAQSALQGVLHTFFGGSLTGAVKAFLSDADADITEQELAQLAELVAAAQEGKDNA
jgi:BlaI family penicillinase repressor